MKRNSAEVELYHATLSGKNNENIASLRRGIDSRRSQGFGQGAGFYLWRSKQRALQHARDMVTAEFSKEVPLEGQPVIVTVRAALTPEDFDIDYEEAGPAFLQFLEPNKDWITQHSAELMAKVNFDGLGISIWGDGMPRRSMRFDSTELSVSQAQSLGRLAERISALEPEVMRRFELAMLKQAEAVKYVGSRPLYPSRVETLSGSLVENPYKAAIPIVSGIAYVRNGREDLPWYTDSIGARPRRDAPTPGNKVFPLTDRIWIEEEPIEVFVHNLPRDAPDNERFRKVRVLMLHDPDRLIQVPPWDGNPRWNDKPELFDGYLGEYRLPDEAMRKFKVIAAPPKLYHAAHKDSAGHIARHGITPRDYGVEKRHVWAALTPERAMRAFIDGGYGGSARNVEVYEIDMTGIPAVLRENGYEVVELLKAVADFFDAPHIRAAASRAEATALGGSYYEDSRIIEGSVPPSRIRKLTHAKANPADLAGRHIPERYLAGLPPALQKQRIRELTESRDAYKKGDYSELPTDRAARKMGLVKESSYTSVAKKRGIEWRGDAGDMAARVLQYYGAKPTQRDVTAFAEALNMSFRKGLAAWKSGGHRPGATAQNWAVARVNSLVVGGKTAWTADQKQFAVLPADVRKKIVAKLPELYKALTAQGRGKDVASIKGKAKANPVVRPELRQMIGKELALDLKRPLYSYAKKMMAKYGSRAAGEELVDDAVHGAQDAIIGHFVNRYDDDMIEMYASIGDLYELRPIAIGVGQEAIRNLIRGSMYGAERPDLQFWERLKAQRRALTEPGGPPPSDEAVAASLGLTLDELNLKRQERQIFSTTSYDRLLGLGVDPGDRTIEVSEVLTYERPEGPPPEIEETTRGGREIMSMVSQGLDPEESTYLRQLGVDEIGGRLLADAIVQAAISRLDPNDRILVDTYVEGDTTLGMSDRQFERAIKGGYDPATRTRVPGLVDRVRPILLDTAEKVMALPEEVRDQIAVGKVDVFDAIRKDAARQKQLAARTQRMLGSGPAPAPPKKVPRLRAFRNR